jgi:hypothetical protein
MKTLTRGLRTRSHYAGLFSRRLDLGRQGREGVPISILVAAGTLGIIGLLATAALRDAPTVRGYAEFEAGRDACSLRGDSLNAVRCRVVAPNSYEITFSRELGDSIAVATRAACCPGVITASRSGRRRVVVSLGDESTYPVRAQVLVR